MVAVIGSASEPATNVAEKARHIWYERPLHRGAKCDDLPCWRLHDTSLRGVPGGMRSMSWRRFYSTIGAALLSAAVLSFGSQPAAADDQWLSKAFKVQKSESDTGKSSNTKSKSSKSQESDDEKQANKGKDKGREAEGEKKPDVLIGDNFAPSVAGKWQWKVIRTKWTERDEEAFGEFIRLIGESDCKTTHECLTSPKANPRYFATNPPGMFFFADCADLPFALRGYFAWKNGLPFSFSTAVALHPGSRYAKSGLNSFEVTGRYHIVPPGPDPRQVMPVISRVSTVHFRIPADYRGKLIADHYPVRIDRASVKAGTVIFDALGHIAVVYKVTDDGIVHFIDAHPDNSLTRGVYGSEFERGGAETGAGFVRWRPQTLVGATKGKDGTLYGGKVVPAANGTLADWSDEQYFGTSEGRSGDWRTARFLIDGDEVDHYFFIRLRLAPKGYRFDPVGETRHRMKVLCDELGQRVAAVDAAIKAGMHKRPQPARLPTNIYVTQGDWESFATPSRDAQLKTMFKDLRDDVQRYVTMQAAGSRHVRYDGTDLRGDLMRAYEDGIGGCSITYTKTDGAPQTLTLAEVKSRLFKMSFDPHHCVERRWGATSAEELKACPDDKSKQEWYDLQQRLRNQIVRTIGDRMDFTLDDLKRHAREGSKFGDDDPPDIAVASLLVVN